MFDYKGKVALVTGGGSGIGRATAAIMANCGASIVIADFDNAAGQAVVDELKEAGHQALFIKVDVADINSVESMIENTQQTFGRLDCLVNCAGISGPVATVTDYPLEDWHRVININLNGTFYAIRCAIPLMLKSGGGAIVTMSSIFGSIAGGNIAAYVASKHAVLGLTKAVAQEFGSQGIRINAVAPGVIETAMTEEALQQQEYVTSFLERTPAGRFGQANEVANFISFLCSDQAGFMTGTYYPIDGGYLSH